MRLANFTNPASGATVMRLSISEPEVPAMAQNSAPAAAVTNNVQYAKPGVKALNYDVFAPKGARNLPIVVIIHGGGWMGGDKAGIAVEPFLKEGISVVSINYRYISQAQDVVPPVKAPL